MKSNCYKLVVACSIILILCILWTLLITHISRATSCFLVYPIYGNGEKATELVKIHNDDFLYLRRVFNRKLIYFDYPSCGFTDQYAIKFFYKDGTSTSFWIATDTCPNYMISEGRMISLNDSDNIKTRQIIRKYINRITGNARRI